MTTKEVQSDAHSLRRLVQLAQQDDCWSTVEGALRRGESASLDGVWGSSAAVAVGVLRSLNAPNLVVLLTAHPNELDAWADEIELFSSSGRHPAAIHHQIDAGDVARQFAGEEKSSTRDVIGCAEPRPRCAAA